MKRFSTPVLDGIAAAPGRFQLRTWLELAAKEKNAEIFHRDLHHIRGYLDALEDAQAITGSEWVSAYEELTGWLLEFKA